MFLNFSVSSYAIYVRRSQKSPRDPRSCVVTPRIILLTLAKTALVRSGIHQSQDHISGIVSGTYFGVRFNFMQYQKSGIASERGGD